jgi:hypothetical protein
MGCELTDEEVAGFEDDEDEADDLGLLDRLQQFAQQPLHLPLHTRKTHATDNSNVERD